MNKMDSSPLDYQQNKDFKISRVLSIIILTFLCFLPSVHAETPKINLEKAPINVNDTASIKRGAKFFATVCMACHSLIYLRYNKIAEEAGITIERMPLKITKWPFDIKPPDLSLEANVRGVNWIYTYLHGFYVDPSRPTGFNNVVLPNTGMTNILAAFQGTQIRVPDSEVKSGLYDHSLQWYDLLRLQKQGTMTPAEFDATITDVVTFLAYAADPYQAMQHQLGFWVIGFLLVLLIFVYLLKRAYWRELH